MLGVLGLTVCSSMLRASSPCQRIQLQNASQAAVLGPQLLSHDNLVDVVEPGLRVMSCIGIGPGKSYEAGLMRWIGGVIKNRNRKKRIFRFCYVVMATRRKLFGVRCSCFPLRKESSDSRQRARSSPHPHRTCHGKGARTWGHLFWHLRVLGAWASEIW